MSEQKTRELKVREIFNYPDPTKGKRRFLIIEYEVIKREIKRYEVS